MSQASVLLSELLALKSSPGSAQLIRLEVRLERAWAVGSRWAWILLATSLIGVLLAWWLTPLDPISRTLITLVLLVDYLAWYGSLIIVFLQMMIVVFAPKVRHAHEVHNFIHVRELALKIATFDAADLDEAELWLKWRVADIRSRAGFILGGQVTAGSLLAAFHGEVFASYINESAAWLASVVHVTQAHLAKALTLGAVILLLEVAAVLGIARRYQVRLRVIEHARLLKAKAPAAQGTAGAGPNLLDN